jgi:hypothetical protein
VFVAHGEVRAVFAKDGTIDETERTALEILTLAVFECDRADVQEALGEATYRAGPESDRVRRLKKQWDELMASRDAVPPEAA